MNCSASLDFRPGLLNARALIAAAVAINLDFDLENGDPFDLTAKAFTTKTYNSAGALIVPLPTDWVITVDGDPTTGLAVLDLAVSVTDQPPMGIGRYLVVLEIDAAPVLNIEFYVDPINSTACDGSGDTVFIVMGTVTVIV